MFICFIIALIVTIAFSGAEIAFGSISRDSIEKLMQNKVRGSTLIYGIIKNKRRFYLMLLSGKIMTMVFGTVLLYTLLLQLRFAQGFISTFIGPVVFVVCFCTFIFAEGILGRLISMGEYESTVPRFAYFLTLFHVLLLPLTTLLDVILSVFIEKNTELAAKEEALKEFVKSESEEGVIEKEENEMIQGVIDFFDTTAREVMVPRIDIIAVEKGIGVDELISLFEKEGHSRIPVYDGRIDNIMGVIYAKDVLPVIAVKGKKNFSITETMRKAYYVPETKKISILLKEFKKTKIHIAVVVDEYGGTEGIVALEDLLEEIVGEIQDEYDQDERDYLWINNRTVLIDAGLDIDDVNEIINAELPNEDFDTLAGFIYHQLGTIPSEGEEFKWGNIIFIMKEINGNRISKVLVKLNEPKINTNEQANPN
ncbi:hemolysin family protein [Candidatus Latescibacterota bacterium]